MLFLKEQSKRKYLTSSISNGDTLRFSGAMSAKRTVRRAFLSSGKLIMSESRRGSGRISALSMRPPNMIQARAFTDSGQFCELRIVASVLSPAVTLALSQMMPEATSLSHWSPSAFQSKSLRARQRFETLSELSGELKLSLGAPFPIANSRSRMTEKDGPFQFRRVDELGLFMRYHKCLFLSAVDLRNEAFGCQQSSIRLLKFESISSGSVGRKSILFVISNTFSQLVSHCPSSSLR